MLCNFSPLHTFLVSTFCTYMFFFLRYIYAYTYTRSSKPWRDPLPKPVISFSLSSVISFVSAITPLNFQILVLFFQHHCNKMFCIPYTDKRKRKKKTLLIRLSVKKKHNYSKTNFPNQIKCSLGCSF